MDMNAKRDPIGKALDESIKPKFMAMSDEQQMLFMALLLLGRDVRKFDVAASAAMAGATIGEEGVQEVLRLVLKSIETVTAAHETVELMNNLRKPS